MLHTLCLSAFYRMSSGTCLEISAKSASFSAQAPGLADTASAKAIEVRHQQWAKQLPKNEDDLWDALTAFDGDSQAALFAHCASLSVNAVHEPWNRNPRRLGHADRLARAVNLDMAAAGWTPTVDNYLGRVPKARILEAVREAKGEASAQLIDHLKKPEMAKEAERLLSRHGLAARAAAHVRRPEQPRPIAPRPPKARACRRSLMKAKTRMPTIRRHPIPRNRSSALSRPNERDVCGADYRPAPPRIPKPADNDGGASRAITGVPVNPKVISSSTPGLAAAGPFRWRP